MSNFVKISHAKNMSKYVHLITLGMPDHMNWVRLNLHIGTNISKLNS